MNTAVLYMELYYTLHDVLLQVESMISNSITCIVHTFWMNVMQIKAMDVNV